MRIEHEHLQPAAIVQVQQEGTAVTDEPIECIGSREQVSLDHPLARDQRAVATLPVAIDLEFVANRQGRRERLSLESSLAERTVGQSQHA